VWFWILVVVFAAFLMFGYANFKNGRTWGKPLMILCTVGVVAVVLVRFAGGVGGVGGADSAPIGGLDAEVEAAEMIGEQLKGKLPAAGGVFFLGKPPVQGAMTGFAYYMASWEKGLHATIGRDWQRVGYFGPCASEPPSPAEWISSALDNASGQIDLVLSFDGLPTDLEALNIYEMAERPLVAAFFPDGGDEAVIRGWLQDGLLDVAVINDEGSLTTILP